MQYTLLPLIHLTKWCRLQNALKAQVDTEQNRCVWARFSMTLSRLGIFYVKSNIAWSAISQARTITAASSCLGQKRRNLQTEIKRHVCATLKHGINSW